MKMMLGRFGGGRGGGRCGAGFWALAGQTNPAAATKTANQEIPKGGWVIRKRQLLMLQL